MFTPCPAILADHFVSAVHTLEQRSEPILDKIVQVTSIKHI